ncbi:F5/8 type C domain-containing protein [Pedobacter steynii]|uniref:F5/8 type C domain-containing protein n=1 Tax=Pedobacter steynii TaxID=430522 RepID=A0A1H0IWY6_9SPHI|nr:DUF4998 domain-containing protein [Pedobacter steynii]NQX42960.1 discoidin domain-containing protein [Pedobacter steynii]SDO35749.1 F5/8 type C domain-containing protein [Pedobacter steynii]
MKTKFYYLFLLITAYAFSFACKKMDNTYKQFVVPGGKYYPGRANGARFQAGNKRGRLYWLRNADPKTVKAKIYWNNYADSVEIPISNEKDTISYMFSNLPENFYTFIIKTYDLAGNASVPVEVPGAIYGDSYQERLLPRPLKGALLKTSNQLFTTWEAADIASGAYATEVEYTNNSGQLSTKRVRVNISEFNVDDYKVGTQFRYRTVFRPDSTGIDFFYTPYLSTNELLLDKSEWKIIDFSSQHPGDENKVTNFIDDNAATRWHTNAGSSRYPHHCTIDIGALRSIKKVGIWRMKDDDRAPDKLQFFTSADNVNWIDQGVFNFNRKINDQQIFTMTDPSVAKYFKVVGVSGPQSYTVLGEITLYIPYN